MFARVNVWPDELYTGFPITQAVLNKSQSGIVYKYLDNYVVLHKSGFSSFIGDKSCETKLLDLFKTQMPQYFHLYDSPFWVTVMIESLNKTFGHKIRERIQLEYIDQSDLKNFEVPSFNHVYLKGMSEDVISFFGIDSDKFWNNGNEMLSHSLGVVIVAENNEPACLCYAAAIGNNKAEVDIITHEQFRGKGLAKYAVSVFINECKKQNIKPNWDCFTENKASLNTATSLHFVKNRNYNFLSIFRNNEN